MNINLKLYKSESAKTKNGFPVIITLREKTRQKRIQFKLFSFIEHWNEEKQMPNPLHPKYVHISQDIIILNNKIEEILKDRLTDFTEVANLLRNSLDRDLQAKGEDFYFFTDQLIDEMKINGSFSNAKVYDTVKVQLKKYKSDVSFNDFDYNFLIGFINFKKMIGVKSTTIHSYLRTLRAIYNQAIFRKGISDKKPFVGVFKGLKIRSHQSKKKYLSSEDILVLENANLKGLKSYIRDLFLLQFYLGGQDLKDIHYLKYENINEDRIYFKRSKVASGYVFDLAITPKVRNILKKYSQNDGEYIFSDRKDYAGYVTFRRRYGKYLVLIQKELNIKIKPLGGVLGIKVARHTFANIGKLKGIEVDMLRELMGHERDDVDNYYKDKYPEAQRDQAQLKIINNL